jgi:hypothetical protein
VNQQIESGKLLLEKLALGSSQLSAYNSGNRPSCDRSGENPVRGEPLFARLNSRNPLRVPEGEPHAGFALA